MEGIVMAGDWIKMRSNLWDDPRIAKLCDLTDQPETMVVGALYWLWAAADQHSEDGLMHGLTLRSIDRKTGVKGIGDALVSIGWIEDSDNGIIIARFDEHNGESAKKRCQTARRVANFKARNATETQDNETGNAPSVTKTLAERDLEEEKRREDKRPTTSLSSGAREEKSSPAATTLKGVSDCRRIRRRAHRDSSMRGQYAGQSLLSARRRTAWGVFETGGIEAREADIRSTPGGLPGRVEEKKMNSISFVVPGAPVGKGRPRFARQGAFVRTFTPEKTANYENLVKLAAYCAMNGRETFTVAVSCDITIELEPAPSWSNKKRMAAISGVLLPTSKPDLDNVLKGILDAMNGVVFKDDKQVVDVVIRKRYADTARVVVIVNPL